MQLKAPEMWTLPGHACHPASDKECSYQNALVYYRAPWVLGIWGEGLFILRELGSTANYFRGAGEQADTLGDLGSTAKK